jgi:hypothetical protein
MDANWIQQGSKFASALYILENRAKMAIVSTKNHSSGREFSNNLDNVKGSLI